MLFRRNYEATVVGVDASSLTAAALLSRFESTASNNFINFNDPAYDEAYEAAAASADDDEKTGYYKECEKILAEDAAVSTSQPSPGDLMDFWNKILEEYDDIVYIPMSSGLSTSCDTATVLSEDYEGKVQVVNNQRISVTQQQSVLDAKKMANRGVAAKDIKAILEEDALDASIYIMVDTLK